MALLFLGKSSQAFGSNFNLILLKLPKDKANLLKGEVDENGGFSSSLGHDAAGLLCACSRHREADARQTPPTTPFPDLQVTGTDAASSAQ